MALHAPGVRIIAGLLGVASVVSVHATGRPAVRIAPLGSAAVSRRVATDILARRVASAAAAVAATRVAAHITHVTDIAHIPRGCIAIAVTLIASTSAPAASVPAAITAVSAATTAVTSIAPGRPVSGSTLIAKSRTQAGRAEV
jgi:hypothetical protein